MSAEYLQAVQGLVIRVARGCFSFLRGFVFPVDPGGVLYAEAHQRSAPAWAPRAAGGIRGMSGTENSRESSSLDKGLVSH